jgi:hypothetical protein
VTKPSATLRLQRSDSPAPDQRTLDRQLALRRRHVAAYERTLTAYLKREGKRARFFPELLGGTVVK